MPSNDKPRLIPTGNCWCGCGNEIGIGKFFASGHDKTAEAAYMAVHHEASVARLLADTGFAPGGKETIREAALDRGGWNLCPRGCDYAGAPASITKHLRTYPNCKGD
ncbi:hypothetical protein OG552_10800 [Streptomyces sp. NBC_01476]|uniref:hypothetical protein n=1 Tax=Streptomyces sp. NBC_01476 TaxID=2903881 RepID=UPI002E33823F|nr:hypothetical protein [Streptomyces sp. NBC_01476]